MEKRFEDIKTFKEMWLYQQCVYIDGIKKNIKYLLVHFPTGYLNFFLHIFLAALTIPIFIGNALEYWTNTAQLRKPKLEDIAAMEDEHGRRLIANAQIKAIGDYQSFLKIIVTFLLGAITVLVPLLISWKK